MLRNTHAKLCQLTAGHIRDLCEGKAGDLPELKLRSVAGLDDAQPVAIARDEVEQLGGTVGLALTTHLARMDRGKGVTKSAVIVSIIDNPHPLTAKELRMLCAGSALADAELLYAAAKALPEAAATPIEEELYQKLATRPQVRRTKTASEGAAPEASSPKKTGKPAA